MAFHRRSSRLGILIALLALIAVNGLASSTSDLEQGNEMDTLVSPEWLNEHIGDPDLVVLDCTVSMELDENGALIAVNGRPGYESGHIPTAGFADLMGDLCDGDSPCAYALPTPEEFCAAMGRLGVGDESTVVVYDANQSVWAARVWWMLRWVGFDRAAVLDGGLSAWIECGLPLSTELPENLEKQLTAAVRPSLIADQEEVRAAMNDESVSLVDAMPEPHFQGVMALYDRPGHIPTACNISAIALLDSTGRYLPCDELSEMCEIDRSNRVITYCGAGIAASSNAFIMTRLGYTDVAVYAASLQEWVADPANPLVAQEL